MAAFVSSLVPLLITAVTLATLMLLTMGSAGYREAHQRLLG